MNEQQIEQEIQAKGLTAPRVTPADIEANIASEHYFTAEQGAEAAAPSYGDKYPQALGLLTFCVLVLRAERAPCQRQLNTPHIQEQTP